MLVIKKKQMAMIIANKRQAFATEMREMLRENHPRIFKFYTDEQLQVWVDRQLDYFDTHEIDTSSATINLLTLFAQYGEMFERCPNNTWAAEIIEDKSYSADHRIALLEHEALKQKV